MKYMPLQKYLESLATDHWRPRFSEIEQVLGFTLPKSARLYPAWWSNQQERMEGNHTHALCWQEAGWSTEDLDLGSERITFCRNNKRRAI